MIIARAISHSAPEECETEATLEALLHLGVGYPRQGFKSDEEGEHIRIFWVNAHALAHDSSDRSRPHAMFWIEERRYVRPVRHDLAKICQRELMAVGE